MRYKPDDAGVISLRDPVSEVDSRVEKLIRSRLAERFPDHDIIGEEMQEQPGRDSEFIWAVDPIDRTTNFVNGFPLFSSSIGILHRCFLLPARSGAPRAMRCGLVFITVHLGASFASMVTPKINAAAYVASPAYQLSCTLTKLGGKPARQAALECAMVAAGLLEVARFSNPNIWDVAGGIALVRAGGGVVREYDGIRWTPMDRFSPMTRHGKTPDLRFWSRPIAVGTQKGVAQMCDLAE